MKKLIYIFAFICVMALTSCSSTKMTGHVDGLHGIPVTAHYAVADIDYSQATKVYGYSEEHTALGFIKWGLNRDKSIVNLDRYVSLNGIERAAMYDAMDKSGADIILEPQFKVIKKKELFGLFTTVTVQLTGWAVKINGFREGEIAK